MKRVIIIVGLTFLILLPIALLILRRPMVSTYLRRTFGIGGSAVTSPQFAADSRTPEAKLTIVDTRYLDYISAKLRIFDTDAIVDRELYNGNTSATKKYTVSRVEFVLVDDLETYVYGATGGKLLPPREIIGWRVIRLRFRSR